jgi:hypothetical protein
MKKIFRKVFSGPILEPIVTIVASILILEYIIFPGLTIDNTLLNIGAGIAGIFLGLIFLIYADGKVKDYFDKKEDKPNEEPLKENEDGKI